MRIEGYAGICACCFAPVLAGEEFRYRDKGRTFHKTCVERQPNAYYVKLERKRRKECKP